MHWFLNSTVLLTFDRKLAFADAKEIIDDHRRFPVKTDTLNELYSIILPRVNNILINVKIVFVCQWSLLTFQQTRTCTHANHFFQQSGKELWGWSGIETASLIGYISYQNMFKHAINSNFIQNDRTVRLTDISELHKDDNRTCRHKPNTDLQIKHSSWRCQ